MSMNIITVPVEKLIGWAKNPRTITSEDLDRLKWQIEHLGVYKPVLVTCALESDNAGPAEWVALGGNQRLKAFIDLGIKEVQCSVVKADDEQRRIEYSLSDNDRAGAYDKAKVGALISPFKDELELDIFKIDTLKNIPDLNDILNELDETEPDSPEIEITPELFESHNYLVLYFDNDLDWEVAQDVFKIRSAGALDSKKGYKREGVGRVIDGKKALKAIL